MADKEPTQAATPYAAATESLRSAAKWLLAAAAAVAGLLVAGLQLGSLGHLLSDDSTRLVVALLGLGLALVGVGAVIWRAGELLSDEWLTLGHLSSDDFQKRLKRAGCFQELLKRAGRKKDTPNIYDEMNTYCEELYGGVATSVGDLYRVLAETNAALRSSFGSAQEADALRKATEVHLAVKNAVDYANYRRTRIKFDSLRTSLASGGIAVVVGLVIFALAGNPQNTMGGHPESNPSEPALSEPAHSPVQTPILPLPEPSPITRIPTG